MAPRLLAFGGGIGGGKTTLRRWLLRQRSWHQFKRAALVDTDEIRLGLRGYAEIAKEDSAALRRLHLLASRIAEARVNRLLAERADTVWESTLGWEPDSDYAAGALELSYLNRFLAKGYRVFLHGVTCDWAVAEERFHRRAERENRAVSDNRRIVSSHQRFEANVPRLARVAGAFWLWRNGPDGFRVVADRAAGQVRMPCTPRWFDPPGRGKP